MQILTLPELNDMLKGKDKSGVFRVLSPLESRFAKIVNKIRGIDSTELVNLLNRINNQGITSIDTNTYSYVIDGCIDLSYSDLATSEMLFLFAYAADYAGVQVFIYHYLDQLCLDTCKLFFSVFGKSDYVNMIVDEYSVSYYRDMLSKEIENDKHLSGE